MVMQNSLLHTAKINRGCVPHGLRKATVDHIGLQHSWTTGTEQDGGSGSVTWSSRRQCFRDPDNSHLFAMWILSQTSHPRDVISHASITLSQDPNKLGIFLRKQTLHKTTDVSHLLCRCARLEALELYSYPHPDFLVHHCPRGRGSPANVSEAWTLRAAALSAEGHIKFCESRVFWGWRCLVCKRTVTAVYIYKCSHWFHNCCHNSGPREFPGSEWNWNAVLCEQNVKKEKKILPPNNVGFQ